LSPEQALNRLSTSGLKLSHANTFSTNDLVYTESRDGAAMLYLFAKPDAGFLLLSADDVARPILGYSDNNTTIDPANIPANMRWWLSEYANEIAAATHRTTPHSAISDDREPIEPLCTTLWDQDDPYNSLCPNLNGNHCYTGCVATAMAQMMRAHAWPQKGSGSITYTWNGRPLSADFSSMTFDWDNMLDSYKDSYTDAQQNAVALLMKACGFSVEMAYGTDQSSASVYKVAPAMVANFKYTPRTITVLRRCFSYSDWLNEIYSSLAEGAPVYYSGNNDYGGHAFVCDGYSSDNYFHINWGWSGLCNGYFLLDALDPTEQGSGGTSYGYNADQIAIVHASPRNDDDTATYVISLYESFDYEYSPSSRYLTTMGRYMSTASVAAIYRLGLKITDAEGHDTFLDSGWDYDLEPFWTYSYYYTLLPDLLPGDYTAQCVFAVASDSGTIADEDWHDVYSAPDNACRLHIHVNDSGDVSLSSSVATLLNETKTSLTEVSANTWLATAAADITSVAIYTMDGSRQYPTVAISGNSATIDATALLTGIYLITVTTPEGITVSKMKK
jgi:hypothetical protein